MSYSTIPNIQPPSVAECHIKKKANAPGPRTALSNSLLSYEMISKGGFHRNIIHVCNTVSVNILNIKVSILKYIHLHHEVHTKTVVPICIVTFVLFNKYK